MTVETGFPVTLQALLAKYLTGYSESRRRWPLWTYERRSIEHELTEKLATEKRFVIDYWTWNGSDSWPDRLLWAHRLPVAAVFRVMLRVANRLERSITGLRLHDLQVATVAPRQLRETQPRLNVAAFATFPLPLHLSARLGAIFAAMAHPQPPSSADEIAVPPRWLQNGWLDDKDVSDLKGDVMSSLLAREEPGRETGPTRLGQFLALSDAAGKASGDSREAKDRQLKATELSFRVFRHSGLIPSRQGGRRALSAAAVRQLKTEATEIVEYIRAYRPAPARLRLLKPIIEADLKEESVWSSALEPLLRSPQACLENQDLFLRLPFLTPEEILKAADPNTGAPRAARGLVNVRHSAELTDKTLQNL